MVSEKIDKDSGAILFKKDPDSIKLDKILKMLGELSVRIDNIEALLKLPESPNSSAGKR